MIPFQLPKLLPHRWRLRDIRRARLTRWLLVAGMLFMLNMQSAMAAYVCMLPPGAMEMTAAADASMSATCPQMKHTAADRMVCAKHCASDDSAPAAAHPPLSVPPNGLLALPPIWPSTVALSSPATVQKRQRDRLRAPPPTPSLLFCSLLI